MYTYCDLLLLDYIVFSVVLSKKCSLCGMNTNETLSPIWLISYFDTLATVLLSANWKYRLFSFSMIVQLLDCLVWLLVNEMDERKKRKPHINTVPVHKKITPVLLRRDTTD